MEGEFKNSLQVWILAITCLTYCYYIPSKIQSGISRLVSLLPIFYFFIILPLKLSTFHLCISTAFLLVWLANFKLFLFAFDQGPLSPPPSKLSHFISIAAFPIKIKTNTNPSHQKTQKLQKSFQIFSRSTLLAIIKLGLFCTLLYAYNYKQYLHKYLIFTIFLLYLYLLVDFAFATCAVTVRAILGFELEPQFNEPFFSTSLQDFWGRRWNLVVSSILRSTIYDPMRRILTRPIGKNWATHASVFATFTVSGLMHEAIYYYLTRALPTWDMTSYFVLHGTCLNIEKVVKRELSDRRRWHPSVSRLLVLACMTITSLWLLGPLLSRDGINEKIIRELFTIANLIRDKNYNSNDDFACNGDMENKHIMSLNPHRRKCITL